MFNRFWNYKILGKIFAEVRSWGAVVGFLTDFCTIDFFWNKKPPCWLSEKMKDLSLFWTDVTFQTKKLFWTFKQRMFIEGFSREYKRSTHKPTGMPGNAPFLQNKNFYLLWPERSDWVHKLIRKLFTEVTEEKHWKLFSHKLLQHQKSFCKSPSGGH